MSPFASELHHREQALSIRRFAVAALRTGPRQLRADLSFSGLLFESPVMRALRVYAQTNNCQVSYFRDSTSLEVDAVIERGNGEWLAAEIKLGGERLIPKA